MFMQAVGKVQNAAGYDEELVALCGQHHVVGLPVQFEVTRQITLSDFRRGELSTQVRSINRPCFPGAGQPPQDEIHFKDGVTSQQEDGGFAPARDAQNIGLLVMPKRAASLVKKTEKVHRVFEPDRNPVPMPGNWIIACTMTCLCATVWRTASTYMPMNKLLRKAGPAGRWSPFRIKGGRR